MTLILVWNGVLLDHTPVVHMVVVLVQAVTLNVALNSHNKALLTILVSNNFVELKGSVFKKFETNNLFQMSCSGAFDCLVPFLYYPRPVLSQACTVPSYVGQGLAQDYCQIHVACR